MTLLHLYTPTLIVFVMSNLSPIGSVLCARAAVLCIKAGLFVLFFNEIHIEDVHVYIPSFTIKLCRCFL